MTTLRFVERLRDLVDGVEVVLSDIWGVVHNGLESFPEACEALHTYRQRGGTVILITNAPRPGAVRLAAAIKQVLQEAVARASKPRYRGGRFRVYDRAGERCRHANCAGVIAQRTQTGRTTYYCPVCQK